MSLYEDLKTDSSMEVWLDFQDNRDDKYILGYNGGKKGTLHSGVSSDFSTDDGPRPWLPRSFGFDATSTLVEVDTVQNLQNTDEWSFSAWMKADESIDSVFLNRIFVVWGGSASVRQCYLAPYQEKRTPSFIYQRQVQNGALVNIATTTPQIAFADEQRWVHHCWVKRSGSGIETYENGISRGSFGADVTSWNGTQTHFALGGYSATYAGPSYLTHAKVAGFTCFSRALTDAEVNALYAGPSRKLGGEKLWLCPSIADPHSGDEGAIDLSGEGNNGSLEGSMTTKVYRPVGGTHAMEFNGTSDYVTVPYNLDNTSDWTVSAWVKVDLESDSSGTMYKILSNSTSVGISCELYKGATYTSLRVHEHGIKWVGSTFNFDNAQDTSWHHVTFGASSGSYFFSLDGEYESGVSSDGSSAGATECYLGRERAAAQRYFDGEIDGLKIYDHAITEDEIDQLYRGGVSETLGDEDVHICPTLDTDTDLEDHSGNGNDGTASGTTITKYNNNLGTTAFEFGSTSHYVDCGDLTPLDFGTGDFSVSAWVKTTGSVGASYDQAIVTKDDASDATRIFWGLKIDGSTGYPLFICYNAGSSDVATGTSDIEGDGQWHHLCGVRDGTNLYMYVDGVEEATATDNSRDVTNADAPVWIGNAENATNNRVIGNVDDVRAFDRALSAREVAKLASTPAYQDPIKTIGGKVLHLCPSLMEGEDDVQPDLSYSGNPGTLTNGAAIVDDTDSGGTRAYSFDGTDDYIDVGDIDEIDGAGEFSFASWVNLDSVSRTRSGVFSKTQQSFAIETHWVNGDGLLIYFGSSSIYAYITSGVFTASTWQHWAVVFDGGETGNANRLKFFLDGVQQTLTFNGTIGTTTPSSSNAVHIGDSKDLSGNPDLDGKMDDVRIYTRALSATEIARLASKRGYQQPKKGVGKELTRLCPSQDDRDGTFDISYNGNNGTLSGATVVEDTDNGGSRAFSFDGTSDYIDIPDDTVDVAAAFSVCAWIKKADNATDNDRLFSLLEDSNNHFQLIAADGDQKFAVWHVAGGTTVVNKYTYNAIDFDEWHFIAYCYDGTTGRLYYDGEEVSSGAGTSISTGSTYNYRIGARGDGTATAFYEGRMDDVRIFDYALSPNQIAMLYNNGQGRGHELPLIGDEMVAFIPSLVGGDYQQTTGIADLSGQPNQGTTNIEFTSITTVDWAETNENGGVYSIDFDGTNDYANGGRFRSLCPVVNVITVSGWGRLDNLDEALAVMVNRYNENLSPKERDFFIGVLSSGKVRAAFYQQGTTNHYRYADTDSVVITANTWHHILAVYDLGNQAIKIYVDGDLKASTETTAGTPPRAFSDPTGTNLIFGLASGLEYFWDGDIDDVRIFDRELTNAEIKHLASQRAPLSRPALSSDFVPPIFWYCPTLDLSRIQTDVTSDLSDEANNGTLTNMDAATDWPVDTDNSGYWANDFDGTDDKIEGDAPVGVGLSALTVSCWINTSMAAGGGIVASAEAASDRSWLVYKTTGDVIAFYATSASNSWDSYITGTTTIHDGNWHHIVAVYDGTNDLKLYIDNASEGSITGTEPATLRTGTGDISIGDWDSTEFDGLIDDIRIFNQALTADQISDLYADGEGRGILTPAVSPSTFNAFLAYRATQIAGVLR